MPHNHSSLEDEQIKEIIKNMAFVYVTVFQTTVYVLTILLQTSSKKLKDNRRRKKK